MMEFRELIQRAMLISEHFGIDLENAFAQTMDELESQLKKSRTYAVERSEQGV